MDRAGRRKGNRESWASDCPRVQPLDNGPAARINVTHLAEGTRLARRSAARSALRCSFCGKPQKDVGKLIAGPKVFICDECVEVCYDIIRDDRRQTRRSKRSTGRGRAAAKTTRRRPTSESLRATLARLLRIDSVE